VSIIKLLLWFEREDIPSQTKDELHSLVDAVCEAVVNTISSQRDRQFNVVIASDGLVHQLNRDFRQKDKLTDVLSFPLGEEDEISGEIYVSWTKVEEQAQDYGHTWQREFCFLIIHGVLHLLGYEHGDEPYPEMREMEERLLELVKLGR